MVAFDKQYWLEHGSTYKKELESNTALAPAYRAQEEALMNLLRQLEFESVLEIGAGYGRITELVAPLLEQKGGHYLATDVSQDALDQIEVGVDTKVIDLDTWYPMNSEFDLVLCSEVLMHRPYEKAYSDLIHLWTVAQKYVILVEWYEPNFKGEAPGCYQHDWMSTDIPIDNRVRIEVPQARQAIYMFAHKQDRWESAQTETS